MIDSVGPKRFGSLTTTAPKRHVPIADGSDLGNRTTLLEKLKGEVTQRQLDSTVPKDIVDAFWVAFNQTEADAKVTGEYEWLPNFNFELRGWRSKANQGHSGTAPASSATNYNGPAPQQYTTGQTLSQALQGLDLSGAPGPASPPAEGRRSASPSLRSASPHPAGGSRPPSPGPTGQQSGSPPQPPGPAGQPSGCAKSVRRSVPHQPWQATYYTIGEVGNHRYRTDLWALVDDGRSGFDVYDVTGTFCALEFALNPAGPETISSVRSLNIAGQVPYRRDEQMTTRSTLHRSLRRLFLASKPDLNFNRN